MIMVDFKQKEVEKARSEYEKIELQPEHKMIFEQMAAIVAPKIQMQEISVRGFIRQAIIQWQEQHKTTISSILKMQLKDRQKAMKEGMDILYQKLSIILKSPQDNKKLRTAIDEAYNTYLMISSQKK